MAFEGHSRGIRSEKKAFSFVAHKKSSFYNRFLQFLTQDRTDPEFPIIILLRSSREAAEKFSRILPRVLLPVHPGVSKESEGPGGGMD